MQAENPGDLDIDIYGLNIHICSLNHRLSIINCLTFPQIVPKGNGVTFTNIYFRNTLLKLICETDERHKVTCLCRHKVTCLLGGIDCILLFLNMNLLQNRNVMT